MTRLQPAEPASGWEMAVRGLLSDPARAELVLACYYDQPLENAAARYLGSAEWSAIRAFLPKAQGLRALDLGAGNGIASFALAKSGFDVTAVEPDPSGLVGATAIRGLAEKQGLPIDVVESWGEQLPFPDASFDVVFARQVMHHARSLNDLAGQIFRVLKPGGRLLALRDHVISDDSQLPAFFDSHPLHNQYGGEFAYTRAAYVAALTSAGFNIHREIGSFDSDINIAPYSRATLQETAARRASTLPGGSWLAQLVFSQRMFPILAPLMSAFDRRPGRLVSYIADRPGKSS